MHPIWKDYIVAIGSSGPYDVRVIKTDDNSNDLTLFEGRVYARPGESSVKVKINNVVADCLARKAQIVADIEPDAGDVEYTIPFQILTKYYDTGTSAWVTKDTQVFYEDWSYDASRVMGTSPLADPVNGRMDPRQYLIHTCWTVNGKSVKSIRPNGTYATNTVSPLTSYSTAFLLDVMTTAGSAIFLDLSSYYPTYNRIEIGGIGYDIVPACNRYVLYYVNAFGGWDSFLIEGPTEISDAQGRTRHSGEYDNTDKTAAGTVVTVNEMTRQYTMRTGWLTESQSLRMPHLLNSTKVYLHDLVDNVIRPVILTGSETQHKTFRGIGRRMISYTITAQLAQERIRR